MLKILLLKSNGNEMMKMHFIWLPIYMNLIIIMTSNKLMNENDLAEMIQIVNQSMFTVPANSNNLCRYFQCKCILNIDLMLAELSVYSL